MDGYAVIDDGRLVGYLTSWFPIEGFRGTDRIAAYVPAWGHGVIAGEATEVFGELYGAASVDWAAQRCDVHAGTMLASQTSELDAWFRSGFGMGTVDAVRAIEPVGSTPPHESQIRQATPADVHALARLDGEHVRHYAEPPVFMVPPDAMDEGAWAAFLAWPRNTAWIAEDLEGPFAFLRVDREFGGSDVAADDEGVFITGAYVRPSHRRVGASTAMLDAALRHYAAVGARCMALDFESFNPEARGFWFRHFRPVCYSLIRVPEFVR
jgi:GNAT superfamily N-acetyltransferase